MLNRNRLLAAFVMISCAAALHAQTDPYYMIDGDGHHIQIVQGGSVTSTTNFYDMSQRAFPVSVLSTIRTTGYATAERGAEYDLSGTPNGTQYPLPSTSEGNGFSDGTTDGSFNYAMGWSTGNVWKANLDWTNFTLMFSAGGRWGGLAYDSSDDTFWLSCDRCAGIQHYDRTGNLLGSFSTVGNLDWDLAYEASSDSLWVTQAFASPTVLYNYSKTGSLLNQITISGHAASFYSGEFQEGAGTPPPPPPLVPAMSWPLSALLAVAFLGVFVVLGRKSH